MLSIDDCEIDHIIAYSLGGSTSIENAQLLHKTCNRSKGCQLSESDEFIDDRDDLSED
ncbi:HNH endonuclease [Butyricicoccus intestinisimiae]|uniref:HNH endonuclease n=1 Tax=Butyricicoccus intestinisimiae TaxID=2841509 RepID=A0ABS6ET95_9FIRM|nr:HNH endonuclease [Butyricicoccus intestinisimiae]